MWGGIVRQGKISSFRLVPTSPPNFLAQSGHFLLPGLAANIFLLEGGTGARVLHVRISLYATGYPKTIFLLCPLCIPRNDVVCPGCTSKDCLVYPLCIPRAVVPATVHKAPKFGDGGTPRPPSPARNVPFPGSLGQAMLFLTTPASADTRKDPAAHFRAFMAKPPITARIFKSAQVRPAGGQTVRADPPEDGPCATNWSPNDPGTGPH